MPDDPNPTAIERDATEATKAAATGPWAGTMSEGNGAPTPGELGRNIDLLRADVSALRGELRDLARDLADVPSTVRRHEIVLTTRATQRSSATWQALFLVLGFLGSIAVGVVLALSFGGKA